MICSFDFYRWREIRVRHVTWVHSSATPPVTQPVTKKLFQNVPLMFHKCCVFVFLYLKVCSLCFCRMSVFGIVMNFIFVLDQKFWEYTV